MNVLSPAARRLATSSKPASERLEDLRRNTSCHDEEGSRYLVAMVTKNRATRNKLMNCTRKDGCDLSCCPVCSRLKGLRYYNTSIKRQISSYPPSQLRHVTVDVCMTDTLDSSEIDGPANLALKQIINDIRQSPTRIINGKPCDSQVKVWGARTVAPIIQSDVVTVRWLWHWDMIWYLDGAGPAMLGSALRAQWSQPHAVYIQTVAGKTAVQVQDSLKKIATYPVKACFTYDRKPLGQIGREWLQLADIERMAGWMIARGTRWPHFSFLGTREPKLGS